MITVTATDIQNNFGHYLQAVQQGMKSSFSRTERKLQDSFPMNQAFLFLLIHLRVFLKMIMMIKQFAQKG